MKQEEIIEGNELIAKFMGYEIPTQTHIKLKWIVYDGVFQAMQFHSQWNWLMPVVEKIESLGYFITICSRHCKIIKTTTTCDESSIKHSRCGFSKIEATWLAVVEFIKLYNENKK